MTLDEKTCQMRRCMDTTGVLKDELPTPDWKNQVWKMDRQYR